VTERRLSLQHRDQVFWPEWPSVASPVVALTLPALIGPSTTALGWT